MNTPSPALTDALAMLGDNLYLHLDEADALVMQHDVWSSADREAAGKLIGDLVLVIRGLLMEHQLQPSGECRICSSAWPCPVVTTIHGVLKDPQRQFVALVDRARNES